MKMRVVRQIIATLKIAKKQQIKTAKIKKKEKRMKFKNKGYVGCYLKLSALNKKGK